MIHTHGGVPIPLWLVLLTLGAALAAAAALGAYALRARKLAVTDDERRKANQKLNLPTESPEEFQKRFHHLTPERLKNSGEGNPPIIGVGEIVKADHQVTCLVRVPEIEGCVIVGPPTEFTTKEKALWDDGSKCMTCGALTCDCQLEMFATLPSDHTARGGKK